LLDHLCGSLLAIAGNAGCARYGADRDVSGSDFRKIDLTAAIPMKRPRVDEYLLAWEER
jgi:hypothetical protein